MKRNLVPKTKEKTGPQTSAPSSIPMRLPVTAHSVSLVVLALCAAIFMLHWAREVLVPLMLGVMISYALSPVVALLQKWHIPRAIGAGILLLAIVTGLGYTVYSLSDDAGQLTETLPEAAQKFRLTLRIERGTSESTMDKVQKAATQIERAASETTSAVAPAPTGVTRVQIERPTFNIKDYFWKGTLGAFGFVGQVSIVLFIAFFLLISGDTFRRKLVKITGPTLSNKKITLEVLDEINGQIQRYMLIQVFTSVLVGIASWPAFLWIGLEHAAIWGIAAGVFNSVPYVGPVVVTGGIALVGLLQFGTIEMALLVAGTSLFITSLEGYLLTPWLTGRAGRMNAVVVFVGMLFWGWLWGVWGLLLGVPILMIIKAVCDQVEDLKPVGELLGD